MRPWAIVESSRAASLGRWPPERARPKKPTIERGIFAISEKVPDDEWRKDSDGSTVVLLQPVPSR